MTIYQVDPEPIADLTQYRSRRERRVSEGKRAPESDIPQLGARRQLRQVERANEYLDLAQQKLDDDKWSASGQYSPDVLSRLSAQQAVIDTHREGVVDGIAKYITDLNNAWHEMQPIEQGEDAVSIPRFRKIGGQVTHIFDRDAPIKSDDKFAAELYEATRRQSWMDDEVIKQDDPADHYPRKAA